MCGSERRKREDEGEHEVEVREAQAEYRNYNLQVIFTSLNFFPEPRTHFNILG